jgi:hypothetical protein
MINVLIAIGIIIITLAIYIGTRIIVKKMWKH